MANKIGWCDRTISPISGCLVGCDFCYARKMARRLKGRFGYPVDEPFRPTFHMDKVDEIYNLSLKGHGRIFLDSMGDWFSEGVQASWIDIILDRVSRQPGYTFLVLTKRPDRISSLVNIDRIWQNLWIGVSVTCQEDVWRIEELQKLRRNTNLCHNHLFVSFEPLHGPIRWDLSGIEWVIIGAESGNRAGKIVPNWKWISDLCFAADDLNIPVFLKSNLMSIVGGPCHALRNEFPEAMQ